MNIESEKKKIRELMREKLNAQTLTERKNKSLHIQAKLEKDSAFLNAKTILFYMNTEAEVRTEELIQGALSRKVRIALPLTDQNACDIKPCLISNLNDLQIGNYGIREPKSKQNLVSNLDEIDLVIVPGLAFDESRYRLGRGKGFYDRFLAKLPRHVRTFGLAFDFQIVKSLPVTELDVPVTRVFHN